MKYQYYITHPKKYTREDEISIIKLMVCGTVVTEATALIFRDNEDLEKLRCRLNWDARPIDLEEEQEEKIKEDCIEQSNILLMKYNIKVSYKNEKAAVLVVDVIIAGNILAEASATVKFKEKDCKLDWTYKTILLTDEQEERIKKNCIEKAEKA